MGGSNGMFDPGNVNVAAPYFISGRTPVLIAGAPWTAGVAVARLVQFGMLDPRTPGAIVPTPIRISQIRMRYVAVTVPGTNARAFEIFRGTTTAQATAGGTGFAVHTPQRRKTTGYPAIGANETSLAVVGDAAFTAAAFTPLDATGPIDIVSAGSLDGGWSIWKPDDLCGHTLEALEGLEVRVLQDNATGTGIFFIGVDFLR